MRVLVTGGAGFIGSHLVDALKARGDDVTVIDDLSAGQLARLEPPSLERIDVRHAPGVQAVVAETRPQICFHLAAQADVRVSVAEPGVDAAVNVVGTVNVLAAARQVGARLVFASTGGALYGETTQRPTSEDHPIAPQAPYGTAKYCAEQYVALFARTDAAPHVILRFGNVYGPRQDPSGEAGVVSIFAGRVHRGQPPRVFGDGHQTRDYVYVADAVRALLLAAGTSAAGTWNIGTGQETSVLALIEALQEAAGRSVTPEFEPPRVGELQASCLDTTAATRDLGFTASIPLREGARRVYAWVAAGEPVRGAESAP